MQAGDRVKLRKDVAITFTRPKAKKHIDWLTRVGEVVSITRFTEMVAIQWPDRQTLDHWPMRALVVVVPAAPPIAPE